MKISTLARKIANEIEAKGWYNPNIKKYDNHELGVCLVTSDAYCDTLDINTNIFDEQICLYFDKDELEEFNDSHRTPSVLLRKLRRFADDLKKRGI